MEDLAIDVQGLHKEYAGRVAVDDVSLRLRAGEVVGLLGPNGAGKTTTVECVAGLRHPDRGRVRVLGLDPAAGRAELRRRLGVQPQHARLPEALRVGEALEWFASFFRQPRPWRELAEEWGLGDMLATRFGALSGGQQQRLSAALALVGDPDVVVLDELTTGLDPLARRTALDRVAVLRARGRAVLLVTHLPAEAERVCDRVVVLAAGRVVAEGTPAALTARYGAATLEEAYLAAAGTGVAR